MEFISSGFENILLPINESPYCGEETIGKTFNKNIKRFVDDYGSERFVLYVNERPISALQIVVNKTSVRVANIITLKEYRRKGFASIVWHEAKRHYKDIHHSDNLSADGLIFAKRRN